MKNVLLVGLIGAALAGCSNQSAIGPGDKTGSSAQSVSITGYVSDSMCGLSHEDMIKGGGMGTNDQTCTQTCVKNGNNYVIADRTTQKIYKVSDDAAVASYAGKQVEVTGSLVGTDPANPVINIQNVKPL
jgi:hypothetical protein